MPDFSADIDTALQQQTDAGGTPPDARIKDPLEAAIEENMQRQDVDLRASVTGAVQRNPDEAAVDLDLSRKSGLPTTVVRENRDQVQQNLKLNELDIDKLKQTSPLTAEAMRNPDAAAISHDDVQNMSWFERFMKSTKQDARQGVQSQQLADIGFKMIMGQQLTPTEQLLINQSRQQKTVDYQLGFFSGIPGAVAEMTPLLADQAVDSLPYAGAGATIGASIGAVTGATAGGTGGAVLTAPVGGVGAAPGAAGGAVAGAIAGGSRGFFRGFGVGMTVNTIKSEAGLAMVEYSNIQDEKGQYIDRNTALGASLAAGVANGVLEKAGLEKVFSRIPGGEKFVQSLAKEPLRKALSSNPAAREFFRRFGMNVGKAILAEGLTEGGQEAITIMAGELAKQASTLDIEAFSKDGSTADFWTAFGERAGGAAYKGAQGGAGFSVASGATQVAFDASAARINAQRTEKQVQELKARAEQSKVLVRDADTFKQQVRSFAANTGNDTVYIQADKISEAFAENPEVYQELAKAIPSLNERMSEALTRGGDVEIPVEEFAAAVGQSKNFDGLIPSVRFDPEAMAQSDPIEEFAAELGDELTDQAVTQDTDVRKMLLDEEGEEFKAYKDTEGRTTVGRGFNMDRAGARERWAELGIQADFDEVQAGRAVITAEDSAKLFDTDVSDAEEGAARIYPGYEELGPNQRAALVGMVFQLGEDGAAEFTGTLAALAKGDAAGVEKGILGSKWATQTPERAKRMAAMLAYDAPGGIQKDAKGFNIGEPLYRGVASAEFLQADASKQPANNKFGNVTYLTRDPKKASDFAMQSTSSEKSNGVVGKYFAKLEHGFDVKGRIPAEEVRRLMDVATGGLEAGDQLVGKKKDVEGRIVYEAIRQSGQDPNKILQSQGYDHLQFGDELAVFSGDNVRSAFEERVPQLEDPRARASAEGLDGADVDLVSARLQTSTRELRDTQQTLRYIPDPRITELLTETERKAYLRQSDQTLQVAHEKMLRTAISDVKKRRSVEYKEARDRLEVSTREELSKEPAYQALAFIQKGEVPADMEGVLNPDVRKLWRRDVENDYGKELADKMPRGVWARTKDESSPVELLASAFGFGGGRDMIETLANTAPLGDNVSQIVQARLDTEFNSLEDVTERAVEELHNSAASKKLDMEYQALAKAANVVAVPREAFERAAKRHIAGLKVDVAMKPEKYRRAEVRAAREAGRALGKKDFVKAAEWKRKQSLNHYLYNEAAAVRSDVSKALPKFRSYMKKPTKESAKRVDPDYVLKAQEILGRYILGPRLSERRGLYLEMYAFDQWIKEKQTNDAAQLLLPQEVLDSQNKAHYSELTVDEFRGLRDNVENIIATARLKNKLMRNKRERELRDVAQEVADSIRANRKEVDLGEGQETKLQAATRNVRGYIGTLLRVETILSELDGFKPLGPAWQNLFADIKAGSDRKATRQRAMSKEVEKLFSRNYSGTELATINNRTYRSPNGKSFSKSDLLTLALNWGNDGNRKALLEQKGLNWNEQNIGAALQQLDARDWKFVQETWTYIDSFWPEVAALEKRRTGVVPERVEGIEVDTPNGKIRGGYYPLRYDSRTSAAAARDAVKDMAELARAGMFARSMTARSHTQARVGSGQRRVKLGFDVMFSHLNEVVHDLEMGEAVEQTYRVMNHGKVMAALEETGGLELKNFMDLWIQDVAAGDLPAIGAINKALTRLRANVAISAMGWKASTTLLQITGFTQTVAVVGVPETINGILKTFAHADPREISKTIQWVKGKSEFVRNRTETFQRDIADVRKRMRIAGKLSPVRDSYFWAIGRMQQLVDIPTWIGAYESGLKKFSGDDAKAVQYADMMLRKAQSSGMMEDISAIERGTLDQRTRGSAAVKLWTSFYSYYNTKFNIVYEKVKTTDFKKPRDVAKFTADFAMLFVVEAMLGDLLLGRGPDEDKDETWLSYGVKTVLLNVAATLPGVREMANAAFTTFGGGPAGGRAFDQVGAAAKQAAQGEFDEAFIKSLNSAGGLLLGYPSGQMNITLDALFKLENGEDLNPVDFFLYRP